MTYSKNEFFYIFATTLALLFLNMVFIFIMFMFSRKKTLNNIRKRNFSSVDEDDSKLPDSAIQKDPTYKKEFALQLLKFVVIPEIILIVFSLFTLFIAVKTFLKI
ncbi:hypothetical protein [Peptostreptococcus faecalis]|uniref:hypothetical protein n=1 Tax=Peptostreptococcus faecalis TaxID=2045015 RepID=UPI000C7DA47F|nr:hypothetical protein [Peptostreptococcus faecalis]